MVQKPRFFSMFTDIARFPVQNYLCPQRFAETITKISQIPVADCCKNVCRQKQETYTTAFLKRS